MVAIFSRQICGVVAPDELCGADNLPRPQYTSQTETRFFLKAAAGSPDQMRLRKNRPKMRMAAIFTVDTLTIQPLIALIIGILILLVPRFLNFLVAIYLILIGVAGLWPHLFAH